MATLREQIAQYDRDGKLNLNSTVRDVLHNDRARAELAQILASLDPRQDETWTVSADDVLTQHYKKQQEPE